MARGGIGGGRQGGWSGCRSWLKDRLGGGIDCVVMISKCCAFVFVEKNELDIGVSDISLEEK